MKSWKVILLLIIALVIDSMCSGFSLPVIMRSLFPAGNGSLLNHFSSNVVLASGFIIVLSPAYILSAPLLGAFSDTGYRKPILGLCLASSVVGYIICLIGILANNLTIILFSTIFTAIGSAMLVVILSSAADIASGQKLAFIYAAISAALILLVPFAQISNVILHASMSDWLHEGTPLVIMIILESVNLILILQFLPETRKKIKAATDQEEYWIWLLDIFSKPGIKTLYLLFFVFQLAWGVYYQNLFHYITTFFHTSGHHGSVFLAYIASVTVATLLIVYPWAIKRISIDKALCLGSALCAIGLILNSIIPVVFIQWCNLVLVAFGVAFFLPSALYSFAEFAGKTHRGFIMGTATPVWAIAWMSGGLAIYFLNDISLRMPIQCAAVLMSLAFLITLLYSKIKNKAGA